MLSKRESKFRKVRLEDLEFTPAHPEKASKVSIFFRFVSLSFILGIIISLFTAPLVFATGTGVKIAQKTWDVMDVDVKDMENYHAPLPIVLTDKDGKEFARFYTQNRVPVKSFADLGKYLPDALVSTEDRKFFKHKGVDTSGIIRSLVNNISGGNMQGASTITMQLVDNFNLLRSGDENESRPTITDKIKEIKAARVLEDKLSKKEIMLRYFNTVSFGNGMSGIKIASETLFDTDPKSLSINQAATLVAMLKGPELYSPIKNMEKSLQRRNLVIDNMVATGKISKEEGEENKKQPIKVSGKKARAQKIDCADSQYPYYCELTRKELLNAPWFGKTSKIREQKFSNGGFEVKTALDRKTMESLQKGLQGWKQNQAWKLATATVTPGTGEIPGVVQSTTWEETQIVLPTSRFQTGSSFKPILAALALEKGMNESKAINSRAGYYSKMFDNPKGGYKNTHTAGTIDMREAIKQSNNVYFVKLMEELGAKNTATFAKRIGLKSLDNQSVGDREGSFALGAREVTGIDMAATFATFASGGKYCTPHTVTAITPNGEKEEKINHEFCEQVISPTTASRINALLKEPFSAGGTAEGIKELDNVRGKTGSTNDWALGSMVTYDPHIVMYGFVVDPTSPTTNPLSNGVISYGVSWRGAQACGGCVYGPYVNRTFKNIGIPGDFPEATDIGDIVKTKKIVPTVIGLDEQTGVKMLMENGFDKVKVEAINCDNKGKIVRQKENLINVCGTRNKEYTKSGKKVLVK